MKTKVFSAVCLSAFLAQGAVANTQAQQSDYFPGYPLTEKVVKLKRKADAFYDEGNFRRAHFIYWGDLAPIGDKYSQYMVGFHNLHGLGVDRDPAEALAWYRLAAERGNPMLAEARDELAAMLTENQLRRADSRFSELFEEYGDRALLEKLVRQDIRRLRDSAGTRITGGIGGPGRVIMSNGATTDLSTFKRKVQERIDRRMEYLKGYVEITRLLDPDEEPEADLSIPDQEPGPE